MSPVGFTTCFEYDPHAFRLDISLIVIHLKTYWGREYYEVHGSTSTYAIYMDLPSYMPVYCTCPAFSFSVLSSEDTIVVNVSLNGITSCVNTGY